MEILERFFKNYLWGFLLIFIALWSVDVLEQKSTLNELDALVLEGLAVLLVDVGISYKWVRDIESYKIARKYTLTGLAEKYRGARKYKVTKKYFASEFNDEYFDLYFGRTIRDLEVIAKVFILILVLVRKFKIDDYLWEQLFSLKELEPLGDIVNLGLKLAVIFVIIAVIIVIVLLCFVKQFDNIEMLMFKKQLDYTPYSARDVKRLSERRERKDK